LPEIGTRQDRDKGNEVGWKSVVRLSFGFLDHRQEYSNRGSKEKGPGGKEASGAFAFLASALASPTWRRLFGGAYHCDDATNAQRPKYGALDLMRHPDGPAPRFGSCYFLLKPAVAARCTFTYLDSHKSCRI
jgi:hypothetical protein